MNPYVLLGSRVGTTGAASLVRRLEAWHDSMVAHERRLRLARTDDVCDDECPHIEARTLWTEAVATLGDCATELRFLRSRAMTPAARKANAASVAARPGGANAESRSSLSQRSLIPKSGPSSSSRAQASQSITAEI